MAEEEHGGVDAEGTPGGGEKEEDAFGDTFGGVAAHGPSFVIGHDDKGGDINGEQDDENAVFNLREHRVVVYRILCQLWLLCQRYSLAKPVIYRYRKSQNLSLAQKGCRMATSHISLAPGLGYGLTSKDRSLTVPSAATTLATDEERHLAFQAIDFFITECKLGAALLARRAGWRDDVKNKIRSHLRLTREHLEQLAEVLELSLDELFAIGANPPHQQCDAFKARFIERGLVVNNKLFAKASFV